jgi:threonine dehydratase
MITRDEIRSTYETIKPFIRVTPVVVARGDDFGLAPYSLTFKLELLQHAGSFKARGAFANLLLREVPAAGVAAASGGNHGAAVAYAAMRHRVPATIFVPDVSSPSKQERIRSYGADLVVGGARYADALEACNRFVAAGGRRESGGARERRKHDRGHLRLILAPDTCQTAGLTTPPKHPGVVCVSIDRGG